MSFTDQVAIITGASSGIGAVFAERLAVGHDLLLVARRRDAMESLAARLMAKHRCAIEVLQADLADENDVAIVAEYVATAQNLALLVNNAGFGTRGLFWEADFDLQEQMHRLHILTTMRLCNAALKNMVPPASEAVSTGLPAACASRDGYPYESSSKGK